MFCTQRLRPCLWCFNLSLWKELVRPAMRVASLCACRVLWGTGITVGCACIALCVRLFVIGPGLDANNEVRYMKKPNV